ncbi:MAG: hypothetical protein A4E50_02309 [Methanosaeta sp. PtaB.Bin087]|nr:MAG: hypothetical protein A4E50_02309 [Methanosaeta sp. PtaB.Bin087]
MQACRAPARAPTVLPRPLAPSMATWEFLSIAPETAARRASWLGLKEGYGKYFQEQEAKKSTASYQKSDVI